MKNPKIAIAVVLAVLLLVVVLQNTESVETKLLFVSVSMPRALLLFVSLAIGYVLGLLTAGRIRRNA